MSGARIITQEELEYQKRFDNGGYVIRMFTYEEGYKKLLKRALKEDKPLTREDFLALYEEESLLYLEEMATFKHDSQKE